VELERALEVQRQAEAARVAALELLAEKQVFC